MAFAWLGNLTMGGWSTFVLFSLPLNLIYGGVLLTRWAFSLGPMDPSVQALWSRGLLQLILIVSAVIAAVGWLQVLWGPNVKRVRVKVKGLPAELNGITLAQISDLHVGPTIRRSYLLHALCAPVLPRAQPAQKYVGLRKRGNRLLGTAEPFWDSFRNYFAHRRHRLTETSSRRARINRAALAIVGYPSIVSAQETCAP